MEEDTEGLGLSLGIKESYDRISTTTSTSLSNRMWNNTY